MENLPPHNTLPASSIPSNQLPPGYTQSLQNHVTPPPPLLYGAKQNISSNSPQLGVPTQFGSNTSSSLHSSNNSPAFNQPGMPASFSQLHNKVSSPTSMLQQQTYTNSTQNMTSQPSLPVSTNPGLNSNTIYQYTPSSTSQGIPQQNPFPNTNVQSNQPGPINGPPQQIITNSGLLNSSKPDLVPETTAYNPQTSNYMPTPNYGPPVTNYGVPASNSGQSTGNFQGPLSNFNTSAANNQAITGPRLPQMSPKPGFGGAYTPQSGLTQGLQSAPNSLPGSQPNQPLYSNPVNMQTPMQPPVSGPHIGPPGVPLGTSQRPSGQINPPPMSLGQRTDGQVMAAQVGPNSAFSGPQNLNQRPGGQYPPNFASGLINSQPAGQNGPPLGPPVSQPTYQYGLQSNAQSSYGFAPPTQGPPITTQVRSQAVPPGPQKTPGPPGGFPTGPPPMQMRPPLGPPINQQPGPPSGPTNYQNTLPQSSMTARYPQNTQPQQNYQPNMYNGPQQMHNLTNQMSSMSVTQSGFNQLWGHQMFDLLQTRNILPEYPDEMPDIKLEHQSAESSNCSREIFSCTLNRIPETNALLQKSRLPLGILIHPFKDLNHLPVIQCSTIVRCRSCRTYINPFVYFLDSKRWKCNLCYRVNDLPEEFQYDPVSKSYGDPTRRPEIKSATIEFIAPGEYMLRPPQPAVYLFLLDVSDMACDSGYLQIFCETLKESLGELPGDARTQVGIICYDSAVHFYLIEEGLTRPREMTVLDIEDVFLPSPEGLLVNLTDRKEMLSDLLDYLPKRHCEQKPRIKASALGAALQAAYKIMSPTGGRVSVFQTCLPNVGPGLLTSREDPNARSSKDVNHLNPATDFYKRLALECSGAQIAVDLFLVSSQYSDLATLSGMSKFSGGNIHHIPVFSAQRQWQADQFRRVLARYLKRKIGLEAVMRVRCTRGISIHAFHGNFFVRSTDLLSLPNVSPDAAFGMQLSIEESLADLKQVCFQAALLYTSTKGERRIRVHTLCLPVASNLTDVMHSADEECIVGLLVKMAVDRSQQHTLSDAREALSNVAVDALSAHRLAQNLPGGAGGALLAPGSLRLLCLHLSAALKHPAFRVGTSTRLDDRVFAMCEMKSLPLSQLMRSLYPSLYPIHTLDQYVQPDAYPDPPALNLSAERIDSNGAYLLDDGEQMIIYVCAHVSPAYLLDAFGARAHASLPDEARELPALPSQANQNLHDFIERLNEERPYPSGVLLLKDTSPARKLFTDKLLDDRIDTSKSYYEFLQHVKSLMK